MILNIIIDPTKTCKNSVTNKEYVQKKKLLKTTIFQSFQNQKLQLPGKRKENSNKYSNFDAKIVYKQFFRR